MGTEHRLQSVNHIRQLIIKNPNERLKSSLIEWGVAIDTKGERHGKKFSSTRHCGDTRRCYVDNFQTGCGSAVASASGRRLPHGRFCRGSGGLSLPLLFPLTTGYGYNGYGYNGYGYNGYGYNGYGYNGYGYNGGPYYPAYYGGYAEPYYAGYGASPTVVIVNGSQWLQWLQWLLLPSPLSALLVPLHGDFDGLNPGSK